MVYFLVNQSIFEKSPGSRSHECIALLAPPDTADKYARAPNARARKFGSFQCNYVKCAHSSTAFSRKVPNQAVFDKSRSHKRIFLARLPTPETTVHQRQRRERENLGHCSAVMENVLLVLLLFRKKRKIERF